MTLNFMLNDELHTELVAAATACEITARDIIGQCVESVLASRRLPHVRIGSHGAFTSGMRLQNLDEPLELVEHTILL
jgi:hypothetical protein